MFFSSLDIYIFFLLLTNFFIFLNGLSRSHRIIYCFLSGKVCTKSISRALTEWANQSLFLSKASDYFNNDGTLNFLSYLNRNIGYKVSFHNKLVVPFGYGNKRSLSVFPFKCVYSHFGFPWESVLSYSIIVAMVRKDGYIVFFCHDYLWISEWNKQLRSVLKLRIMFMVGKLPLLAFNTDTVISVKM